MTYINSGETHRSVRIITFARNKIKNLAVIPA